MFRENCGDKMDAFLSRTYYINGGYDNRDGMSRLDERMKQIEVSLCVFYNIWTDKQRQFNDTLPASFFREYQKRIGYFTSQCLKKLLWMWHATLEIKLRHHKAGLV